MSPELGKMVVFCDEKNRDHDALITAVWGEDCVNLLYVSPDASKEDSYGRQIERHTSVVRVTRQQAPGMYWRFPSEDRIPATAKSRQPVTRDQIVNQ